MSEFFINQCRIPKGLAYFAAHELAKAFSESVNGDSQRGFAGAELDRGVIHRKAAAVSNEGQFEKLELLGFSTRSEFLFQGACGADHDGQSPLTVKVDI